MTCCLDSDYYINNKPFCACCQKIIFLFTCNITYYIYLFIHLFLSLTLQEAKKVAFMAFVGVCIIFQAIISDVYVYNKKAITSSPTMSTLTPKNENTTISSLIPPKT